MVEIVHVGLILYCKNAGTRDIGVSLRSIRFDRSESDVDARDVVPVEGSVSKGLVRHIKRAADVGIYARVGYLGLDVRV